MLCLTHWDEYLFVSTGLFFQYFVELKCFVVQKSVPISWKSDLLEVTSNSVRQACKVILNRKFLNSVISLICWKLQPNSRAVVQNISLYSKLMDVTQILQNLIRSLLSINYTINVRFLKGEVFRVN